MENLSLIKVYVSSRHRLLALFAALVFVLSQTVDLQHSHDGNLNLQADCHICLKLGSQHFGIAAEASLPEIETATVRLEFTLPATVITAIPAPRSRAPPQTA